MSNRRRGVPRIVGGEIVFVDPDEIKRSRQRGEAGAGGTGDRTSQNTLGHRAGSQDVEDEAEESELFRTRVSCLAFSFLV